jgi:hypothetical protein
MVFIFLRMRLLASPFRLAIKIDERSPRLIKTNKRWTEWNDKKGGNVTESPVVIGTELGIDSWRAKSTCKVAQEFPKGRRGKKMLTGKSVPLFAVASESVATGKMAMAGQTNAALDIDEVNDNFKKRFPFSPIF